MKIDTKKAQQIKVLHIPTSGLNSGGITRFILSLLENIPQDDPTDLHILSPFPIRQIDPSYLAQFNVRITVLEGRRRNPLNYLRKLFAFLQTEKFDILHAHGSSAILSLELLAGKLAGIPVRIAHSHNTTCNYPTLHWILSPLFHQLYTHALACNKEAGKWLFGKENFTVLYNGINLKQFSFSQSDRVQIRNRLKLDSNQALIGHIGQFNEQKNHDYLLEVFAEFALKNPNAKLLLIGKGTLEKRIKAKVDRLNLSHKVYFIGNVSNPSSWLSAMDLFVFPSLFEGLSIALIEAQANGLPILAADTIPNSIGVTSKLTFFPLEQGPKNWAKKLLYDFDSNTHTLTAEDYHALTRFDIQHTVQTLHQYYQFALLSQPNTLEKKKF